ncbi:MAG TPA: glycerol kinase GlpK [Allosphingosinicella sp.]|nr:glycerol kinase GlpK [Allosphingosinicella sp.]
MGDRLLVIDEGTTSTRAMLFARDGTCLATEQRELAQHYPQPGWVEHDAEEIWASSLDCARAALAAGGGRAAALGITNQRETIVFWSRRTGRALAPAIVWQDRRTAELCARLKAEGQEEAVQAKTGLLLDPYFSASKIAWALEHWPQLGEAGGDLCVGTVESWLVFKLTGGLHVSDATNASRTALMDIGTGRWDEGLLDLWGVPAAILPEIVDCAGPLGEALPEHFGAAIPIAGMAGDQQAASIGQACLAPGNSKATYGTGAFILTHTGAEQRRSRHRLLSTIAWQLGGERSYALEGSVFVAGSLVKWLRDDLGLLGSAAETEALARSVPDSGGVQIVPGHSGLGAPYWRPDARGAITGLSFATGRAHIARAALEAMAHQTHDLMAAFAADGAPWEVLKVDGGMASNGWLAQDLADMLGLIVERPGFVETTALGAAMLAGVGCGMFASLEEAAAMRGAVERFEPAMAAGVRDARLAGWKKAVEGVLR